MAEQTRLTDAELEALRGHAPGPWTRGHSNAGRDCVWTDGRVEPDGEMGDEAFWIDCNTESNARLIAAAPAMAIALQMISEGLARIERSGTLREFCFDGIRYVMNGDWNALIDVIGWDRARAAIDKAGGAA